MTETLTDNESLAHGLKLARQKRYRETHQEACREYAKNYWLRNKSTILERQRESIPVRLGRKERLHLLRARVLMYYSNPRGLPICNNCGVKDNDVLCIDHIYSGGTRHARELNSSGVGLHGWLVRSGFPKGFQVLCANCNMKKAKLEYRGNGESYSKGGINAGHTDQDSRTGK